MLHVALRDGADVLQIGIMSKVPPREIGPTPGSNALKPGLLQADIRMVPKKNGRGWLIGAGTATSYVLRWLEYGHLLVKGGHAKNATHGGGKGKVIGHVPAYPVLRPAFDVYWKDALHAVALGLQTQIANYWTQTLCKLKRAA